MFDGRGDAGGVELVPAVVLFRCAGPHMIGKRRDVCAQALKDHSGFFPLKAGLVDGFRHPMRERVWIVPCAWSFSGTKKDWICFL